jgi:regulator of sigma E protease
MIASFSIAGFLLALAAFIFVLTVVVFIHELGHFLVARWCGVKVSAFSIGFGPELYAYEDKQGTRWRVALWPLGGYVRFMDDENGASVPDRKALENLTPEQREGAFQLKPVWQRAAVVAAGPIANFLLALLLLTGIFWWSGERVVAPRIEQVIENSAASEAGFKAGDLIVSINGQKISTFADLRRITAGNSGEMLTFVVDRGGVSATLKAAPRQTEIPDGFGGKIRVGQLGLRGPSLPTEWQQKSYGPLQSVGRAAEECWLLAEQTWTYIGRVLTWKESGDQIGGPARIADASGKMASAGFLPLLHFIAFISVSIGLANLLPIPLLDGGHLVFYAIEAVRGYPLTQRTQDYAFRLGLAVVLFLFIFANWNDRVVFKSWLGMGG